MAYEIIRDANWVISILWVDPLPGNNGKRRLILAFLTTHVIILVMTITGRGGSSKLDQIG